jgi:hypothetical protein
MSIQRRTGIFNQILAGGYDSADRIAHVVNQFADHSPPAILSVSRSRSFGLNHSLLPSQAEVVAVVRGLTSTATEWLPCFSAHAVFVEPVCQRSPAHTQISRGPCLIAAASLQSFQNHLLLNFFQTDTVLR